MCVMLSTSIFPKSSKAIMLCGIMGAGGKDINETSAEYCREQNANLIKTQQDAIKAQEVKDGITQDELASEQADKDSVQPALSAAKAQDAIDNPPAGPIFYSSIPPVNPPKDSVPGTTIDNPIYVPESITVIPPVVPDPTRVNTPPKPKYAFDLGIDDSPATVANDIASFKDATFSESLKFGSTGDSVKDLQNFLNYTYSAKLVVDGIYGVGTAKAVDGFQVLNSLHHDGYFGKLSRAKASELLAKYVRYANQ